MDEQTQTLLTAVLALPEAQRALLAQCLLESLSPEAEAGPDDELEAELDRRLAEFELGGPAVAWEDLKREE